MIEWVRNWILGLTGAAVVCAAATELCPRGPAKGILRVLCAVVMAAALLSPLLDFDFPAYALNMAQYREQAAALNRAGTETGDRLRRRVIEQELRAYILDKAQTLGAAVTDAAVTVQWSTEGLWYPTAAELAGPYHAALSAAIAAELGIPAAAQSWRYDEGS